MGRKLRKQDLIGQSFVRDAAIVSIDEESGTLSLTHVEATLSDGSHIIFNGEIRISLKDFQIDGKPVHQTKGA